MANSLGGSPLGLTGLTSVPNSTGMSSFYGGNTSNINVVDYNNGIPRSFTIDGENVEGTVSLFTGDRVNRFWGNVGSIGSDRDSSGLSDDYKGVVRNDLHNNDVYDTSVLNIIQKLSPCPRAALRALDFAYLKNLGVFPNNRLMIARRFSNPVKDNIMDKTGSPPKSVMISWKPEGVDFLTFNFGEEWEEADADFTQVLNGIGGDIAGKSSQFGKLGDLLGNASNAVPLPGLTEIWQRSLFESLGIFKKGSDKDPLPSGNPNLIKMAKRRKTIDYGNNGYGLKCNISIQMEVEYEQKFISGIDPTTAWMDILSNALSFGTSNSYTYGLNPEFAKKIDQWTTDPKILLDDIIKSIKESFISIKDKILEMINGIKNFFKKTDVSQEELQKKADGFSASSIFDDIVAGLEITIKSLVRKYKIEIMGIANALSGAPSTPWHITVGNPLRPIFCSGDMLTEDVSVTLGPTLSFNDLPSSIKVGFTLKNARPLGMQEILAKFNTGYLRVTQIKKDFVEKVDIDDLKSSSENTTEETENKKEILAQTTGILAPEKNTTIPSSSAGYTPNVGFGMKTTKESDI